jgi:hypothetical protein
LNDRAQVEGETVKKGGVLEPRIIERPAYIPTARPAGWCGSREVFAKLGQAGGGAVAVPMRHPATYNRVRDTLYKMGRYYGRPVHVCWVEGELVCWPRVKPARKRRARG